MADTSLLDASLLAQGSQLQSTLDDLSIEKLRARVAGNKAHLTKERTRLATLVNTCNSEDLADTVNYKLCVQQYHKVKARYAFLEAAYDTLNEKMQALNPLDEPRRMRYQKEWTELDTERQQTDEGFTNLQVAKDKQIETEKLEHEAGLLQLKDLAVQAQKKKDDLAIQEQRKKDERDIKDEYRDRDNIKKSFKLAVISKDFTISDLDEWKKSLKAYWSINNLESLDRVEQIELFLTFLNTELKTEVRQKMNAKACVFDTDGNPFPCGVDVLTEIFNLKYPLFSCRATYFSMRKQTGETCNHFYARLLRAGLQAQLGALSINDIHAQMLHAHIETPELEEKWNKRDQLSLLDMERHMNNYDRAQAIKSTKTVSTTPAATVAAASLTPGNRNTYQRDQNTRGIQCFRCGDGHLAQECRRRYEDLNCSRCNKQGHVAKVCQQQFRRPERYRTNRAAPAPPAQQKKRRAPQPPVGTRAPGGAQLNNVQQAQHEAAGSDHESAVELLAANAAAAVAHANTPFMGPAQVSDLRGSLPTPTLQM